MSIKYKAYKVILRMNNGKGVTLNGESRVEFYHDLTTYNQYGLGWKMRVYGRLEPVDGQEYDLQCSGNFDSHRLFSYIADFYESRFGGEMKWKLISIEISDDEFIEE